MMSTEPTGFRSSGKAQRPLLLKTSIAESPRSTRLTLRQAQDGAGCVRPFGTLKTGRLRMARLRTSRTRRGTPCVGRQTSRIVPWRRTARPLPSPGPHGLGSRLQKCVHFPALQIAPPALWHIIKIERTEASPAQPDHGRADRFEHPPDDAIPTLMNRYVHASPALGDNLQPGRSGRSVFQPDPAG